VFENCFEWTFGQAHFERSDSNCHLQTTARFLNGITLPISQVNKLKQDDGKSPMFAEAKGNRQSN
jgi:hypothetical protein